MALRTIQERIYFPARLGFASKMAQPNLGNIYNADVAASQINGAGDKVQQVGTVQWEDGSSGLTVDKILFRAGGITTNLGGANTIRVGMQTVAVSGSTRLGSGTWKCYGDRTSDLTANSSNSVTMTTTTQTISHGDTVAVVVEAGSWVSADFFISTIDCDATFYDPSLVNVTGGTYSGVPCVAFQAVTGQWGVLVGGSFASSGDEYRFDSAGTTLPAVTSYTEYGNVFRVPFRCRATGFWFIHHVANNSTALEARLYRGAPSSPGSSIKTVSGGAEAFGPATTTARLIQVNFSPVTIEKDEDYIVTIQTTGADDHRLPFVTHGLGVGSVLPGGSNTYSVYRTGTGAFTSSVTTWIPMGIIIDQIDDSSGNWAPGSGTTGNTLRVEADPSAAGATGVAGSVFAAPDGSDMVGPKIGEFTGESFEAALVDGKAVLKVLVSAFGGTGLLLADTPVVLLRNADYTTGFVSATVINE